MTRRQSRYNEDHYFEPHPYYFYRCVICGLEEEEHAWLDRDFWERRR